VFETNACRGRSSRTFAHLVEYSCRSPHFNGANWPQSLLLLLVSLPGFYDRLSQYNIYRNVFIYIYIYFMKAVVNLAIVMKGNYIWN
jgi:uncharacterized membrane protein